MDDLWADDARVLAAIVHATEIEGQEFPDIPAILDALGLDPQRGHLAVRRLVTADMVTVSGSNARRGTAGEKWPVNGVTERGLREAGAWPDRADQLAAQLIAALAEAAEREPEPEKRSKLRTAANGVAGVGREVLTEVLASYAAKITGAA